LHFGAAASAEPVVTFPIDQLLGATREIEHRSGNASEPGTQSQQHITRLRATRSGYGKTRSTLISAEIKFGVTFYFEPTHLIGLQRPRRTVLRNAQNVLFDEYEIPSVIVWTLGLLSRRFEIVRIMRPHLDLPWENTSQATLAHGAKFPTHVTCVAIYSRRTYVHGDRVRRAPHRDVRVPLATRLQRVAAADCPEVAR